MDSPQSRLTLQRPDIWQRAVILATTTTGYSYPHKAPLADGTVYACGGGVPTKPNPNPNDPLLEWDDVSEEWNHQTPTKPKPEGDDWQWIPWKDDWCRWDSTKQTWIRRRSRDPPTKHSLSAFVPDGAMEWLLHEVGHYVAATPIERASPHYGYTSGLLVGGLGKQREWQAWGFEEIILAPFGHSRYFAPPSQQTGTAFIHTGPIPHFAMRHAERQIVSLNIDIEQWRTLYGEWIEWDKEQRHG